MSNLLTEKKRIIVMKKYFQLIIDLGFDYDGFHKAKDLKGLIDELVRIASLGLICDTNEKMYEDEEGNSYNILLEKLKNGSVKNRSYAECYIDEEEKEEQ